MAINVPTIRVRDEELARVQDNLTQKLQELGNTPGSTGSPGQLELFPLMAQPRGPGTPKVLSKPALKIHGDTSQAYVSRNYTVEIGDAATAQTPQQDVQLGLWGRIVLWGTKLVADPFVIVPGLAGAALRITNLANSANVFLVDSDGNVTAAGAVNAASATLVSLKATQGTVTTLNSTAITTSSIDANTVRSAAGFNSYLPMVSQTGRFNSGFTPFTDPVLQNITTSFYMPRAGSITSMRMTHISAGTSGGSIYAQLRINGSFPAARTNGATAGSATQIVQQVTFSKGAVPFPAGAIIDPGVVVTPPSGSTGVDQRVQLQITVELGA